MRTRILLPLGSATVLALALAGCSSSTSTPSETPTPTPTVTSSASPTQTGDVLPPVIIDGKEKAIDASVGDILYVSIPGVTEVSTDNAQVLEVTQPNDDGSAQYAGGAKVLTPGTAKLTIKAPSGTTVVTVTAAP